MNRLNLVIALLFCLRIHAQDKNVLIHGTVNSNGRPVENIHIINLSARKGSLSDKNGMFQITARLNDTLMFSGIQYEHKRVVIDKEILFSKELHLRLTEKVNRLDEVLISSYDLTGILFLDSKKHKDTLAQKAAPLNFGAIDFYIPSLSVAKQLDPDNMNMHTDQSIPLGGDIIGLLNMITGKSISNLFKKNRKKKEQKEEYNYKRKNILNKIRKELGDQFFTDNLHIDSLEIEAFILFCKPDSIIDLYLNDKKLEMIDVFIQQSNAFAHR